MKPDISKEAEERQENPALPSEIVAKENEFSPVAIKPSEVVKVKVKVKVFPAAAKCRVTDFPARQRETEKEKSPERNHTSTGQLDAHLASTPGQTEPNQRCVQR